MEWQRLGSVEPGALAAARDNAHWAAQILSATGQSLLPALPDTSHTAMVWLEGWSAFATHELGTRRPCRVALRLADLTLLVIDRQGAPHDELPLHGVEPDAAFRWVGDSVRRFSEGELDSTLKHPGYEMPAHPIAEGAPYQSDAASLGELARWYANAELALGALANRTQGATPVLCWPHHFDIATLIEVEHGADGAATRTIGVGLSPGDSAIAEPYVYVTHWPDQGAQASRPSLGKGVWHTEGCNGAILHAQALVGAVDARGQRAALEEFLERAVAANRAILGGASAAG